MKRHLFWFLLPAMLSLVLVSCEKEKNEGSIRDTVIEIALKNHSHFVYETIEYAGEKYNICESHIPISKWVWYRADSTWMYRADSLTFCYSNGKRLTHYRVYNPVTGENIFYPTYHNIMNPEQSYITYFDSSDNTMHYIYHLTVYDSMDTR